MMIVDDKHPIGSVVYLTTDPHQHRRIVTAIVVRSATHIQYELSLGDDRPVYAVDIEISKEKSYIM